MFPRNKNSLTTGKIKKIHDYFKNNENSAGDL